MAKPRKKHSVGPAFSLVALTKPAAVMVVLGCMGAALPLAFPEFAIDHYSASATLRVQSPQTLSQNDISNLTAHLQRELKSETNLNAAISTLKLNPESLSIAPAPSLVELLSDLVWTQSGQAKTVREKMLGALSQGVLISQQPAAKPQMIVTASAADEQSAKKIAGHFALIAQAEIGLYQQSGVDLELRAAREALDKIEAELTGFQLRFGNEKIDQMGRLKQEFDEASRTTEVRQRDRRDLVESLNLAKKLKPSDALDQALPVDFGFDALRDLQVEYASAKSQLAGLSADYGSKHPKMLAAQANLDSLKSGAAKALRQSLDALREREKASADHLVLAEQQLAALDERLTKLGNAPAELEFLGKRLETARQHYLSLADIAAPQKHASALTAQLVPGAVQSQPITNWWLLAFYSALLGIAGSLIGYAVMARRSIQEPAQAAVEPRVNVVSRSTLDELKRRRSVRVATPLPEVIDLPVTDPQDSPEPPFDQKVRALLMRHAISDQSKEFEALPPLVRAAAKGKIEFTQAEIVELSEIHRDLKDLRSALLSSNMQKSTRAASI